MRELEFLPDWYPQMRRRRRLLALQVWGTLTLAAGLGLWLLLTTRNVAIAQQSLSALTGDLDHTQGQLKQLDELVALEVVESISHETVRQTLKKTKSSRGCIVNG